MAYTGDVWMTPVVIDSTNKFFCLHYDTDPGPGTEYRVSVTEKTYYLHTETDAGVEAAYPSLYTALAAALSSAVGETFVFAAWTPTASTGITMGGVRMFHSSTPIFQINFGGNGAGTFTMDPGWFGQRQTHSNTDTAIYVVGEGGASVKSPYTVRGRWYSWSLADGIAVDKVSRPYRLIKYSSPRPADAVSVEWDSGRWRDIRYQHVWGAHVTDRLARTSADWTTTDLGGLAQYDNNNAWELVWESLGNSETVLIVHNHQSSMAVKTGTDGYDGAKAMDADEFEASARLMNTAGAFFDVGAKLYLTDQNYDH
ncbi:MAG TPA: hypothetical protein VM487_00345 [Phycisphaerae bacterium]|nr:hypothetical protein [Phycisphaerae bacterium]